MKHSPLGFALLFAACAATPNPDRAKLEPVPSPIEQTPAKAPAPDGPGASGDEDAVQDGAAAAAVEADSAAPERVVGRVGGLEIPVEEFLSRLWMRDGGLTREVLEQIVFERLTLLEADRLGLGVEPNEVEEILADAYASMGAKLAEAGSKLTVTEHIRQNLEMDPAFYEGHLRSDAIVQLLAERCVRAWALASERALVDVLEVEDEDALDAVRAALDAGRTFEDVAAEFGSDRTPSGAARLSIVRSENHPLARLAFATRPGEVGGPLFQSGGYLLILVREHLAPEPFEPGSSLERLTESLAQTGVDNLEFVQWRAAMVRRYTVDLAPFFELVGDRGPQ